MPDEKSAMKFSEKIGYSQFTLAALVTFSVSSFSRRHINYDVPFKEAALVNNLDVDVEVFDPADINSPLCSVKAAGGSFTFSKQDLLEIFIPFILRNAGAADATSGNVILTMIR